MRAFLGKIADNNVKHDDEDTVNYDEQEALIREQMDPGKSINNTQDQKNNNSFLPNLNKSVTASDFHHLSRSI